MKFFKEIHFLLWILIGTSLIFITLSGTIRATALWVSGATLVIHLLGAFFQQDE